MAMYHLNVRYFSRRRGQSAVAAASYRSGQRLYDRYYGELHDFTVKGGIVHTMILLPENAPPEFSDRETLWNSVEHAEKYRNSRLAREVEAALPTELTLEEQVRMTERYVTANFVDKGMIADVAIHDKGDGNPHVHILLTTREVGFDGFNPKKNREWDKRENVNEWRREWANVQNREFARKGLEIELDHESYAVQDFDREIERRPTIHLGHQVKKLDRMGRETDRMNEYREIAEYNREIEREYQQQRERNRNRGRER